MKVQFAIRLLLAFLGLLAAVLRLGAIHQWTLRTVILVFCGLAAIGLAIQNFINRRKLVDGGCTSTASMNGQATNRKSKTLIYALFPWGMCALVALWGAGMLAYVVLNSLYLAHVEQKWPSINATVLNAAVRSEVEKNRSVTWSPVWTYVYTVGSHRYVARSTDISGGYSANWYSSKELAEADASSKPIGKLVVAFYDPSAPQKSVLDRRTPRPGSDAVVLGLSALLFVFGWFCWRMSVDLFKRDKGFRSANCLLGGQVLGHKSKVMTRRL